MLKRIFCKHDYRRKHDFGHYFLLKCRKCKSTRTTYLQKPL
ncbi:hypothetical protein VP199E371_P0040 [Vibrio phage 199E37-1]|nr:hypothetical protein VP199E371_P0040 [Vibrio phage 199E37-1]